MYISPTPPPNTTLTPLRRSQASFRAEAPQSDVFVRFEGSRTDRERFRNKLAEGTQAFKSRDFMQAYRCYQSAREWSDPANLAETIQALDSLGCVCTELHRFDEGKRHLNEGIRLVTEKMQDGPKKCLTLASLQNDLGKLCYSAGDNGAARQVLETGYANILKGTGNDPARLSAEQDEWAEINQILGYIAEQENRTDDTIIHYEAALAFQERHDIALDKQFHNLTRLARLYFYEAQDHPPGSPNQHALTRKQNSCLERAQEKVSRMVALFPNNTGISQHLETLNETLMLTGQLGTSEPQQ